VNSLLLIITGTSGTPPPTPCYPVFVFVSHVIFLLLQKKRESQMHLILLFFGPPLFTLDRSVEYSVTLKFGLAKM
jgi:hypothetical protein